MFFFSGAAAGQSFPPLCPAAAVSLSGAYRAAEDEKSAEGSYLPLHRGPQMGVGGGGGGSNVFQKIGHHGVGIMFACKENEAFAIVVKTEFRTV